MIVLIIFGGYEVGRKTFLEGYLMNSFIPDKNYIATALSIKGQTTMIINSLTVFGIGYIMNYSYKMGFYVMGGILFVMLLMTLPFVKGAKSI